MGRFSSVGKHEKRCSRLREQHRQVYGVLKGMVRIKSSEVWGVSVNQGNITGPHLWNPAMDAAVSLFSLLPGVLFASVPQSERIPYWPFLQHGWTQAPGRRANSEETILKAERPGLGNASHSHTSPTQVRASRESRSDTMPGAWWQRHEASWHVSHATFLSFPALSRRSQLLCEYGRQNSFGRRGAAAGLKARAAPGAPFS